MIVLIASDAIKPATSPKPTLARCILSLNNDDDVVTLWLLRSALFLISKPALYRCHFCSLPAWQYYTSCAASPSYCSLCLVPLRFINKNDDWCNVPNYTEM